MAGGNDNLVQNPSFEGEYSAYIPPGGHPDCEAGICTTAQMAPNWIPWWRSHDPNDPDFIIRMPEYNPADGFFNDPPRVRTEEKAQHFFTFFSTHEAGFLQQVPVVTGRSYQFQIWGHAWSADDDDDAYSGPDDGLLGQKGSTSGAPGDPLTATINTNSIPLGTYATTLTLTANPAVPGSPVSIPIKLIVAEEVSAVYMPVIFKK